MKKHLIILLLSMFTMLILAACGPQASLDEPPVIRYGEDICDECNMIIDDSRFAASYVTNDGEVRRFDDIGDMLVHVQKNNDEVHIYWVHDYNSEEWINADTATFVLSPNLNTPMAWGLAAFVDNAGAEAFMTDNGGSMTTFAELLHEVETGAIDPDTLSDHVHDEADMEHEQEEMEMEGEQMDHDDHDQNDTDMDMEDEQN